MCFVDEFGCESSTTESPAYKITGITLAISEAMKLSELCTWLTLKVEAGPHSLGLGQSCCRPGQLATLAEEGGEELQDKEAVFIETFVNRIKMESYDQGREIKGSG